MPSPGPQAEQRRLQAPSNHKRLHTMRSTLLLAALLGLGAVAVHGASECRQLQCRRPQPSVAAAAARRVGRPTARSLPLPPAAVCQTALVRPDDSVTTIAQRYSILPCEWPGRRCTPHAAPLPPRATCCARVHYAACGPLAALPADPPSPLLTPVPCLPCPCLQLRWRRHSLSASSLPATRPAPRCRCVGGLGWAQRVLPRWRPAGVAPQPALTTPLLPLPPPRPLRPRADQQPHLPARLGPLLHDGQELR